MWYPTGLNFGVQTGILMSWPLRAAATKMHSLNTQLTALNIQQTTNPA